jgi:hypothetical protein
MRRNFHYHIQTCPLYHLKTSIHLSCIYTYTEIIPIMTTGFLPYRSAIIPHNMDVKALPSMYADPITFSQSYEDK